MFRTFTGTRASLPAPQFTATRAVSGIWLVYLFALCDRAGTDARVPAKAQQDARVPAEPHIMKLDIIPVRWTDEGVEMLDQRLLPTEEKWLTYRDYNGVAAGIKDMVVRGAPAIGVSAAYGMALGAKQFVGTAVADLEDELDFVGDTLTKTRPTAVNLQWAVDRMKATFQKAKSEGKSVSEIKEILKTDAKAIHDEDIEAQRLIAQFGGALLADNDTV